MIILTLLLGTLTWSLTMVKSGLLYDFGIGFWGANAHDGLWHIALAQNLSKGIFENPVMAGYTIQNYHLGFDLLLMVLHRLTGIGIDRLYFQVLPPLLALLIGTLTYKFVIFWTKSKGAALGALFFTYFGGSMGWLLGFGESAFWSTQSISTPVNPPFALSLVLVLSGLIALQKKSLLLSVLFFGILIQVKAYAAILILGGLFVSGVYTFYIQRSMFFTKAFLGTLIMNLIFFALTKNNAQSVFTFQPFWFLETMFAASDRLPWPKMAEAMLSYKNQGVVVKYILSYGFAFLVFVVGNFWTRLIFLKDIFKKPDWFKIFSFGVIFAGVVIPVFFVQSGTPWNTIQFIYYSLFFSGILAGVALSRLTFYILLATLILTVPTTILTLKDVYLPTQAPARITKEEAEALNFLKSQPRGIVLTYPYEKALTLGESYTAPVPAYKYAATSYVTAYSQKPLFFEKTNASILGYKWQDRFKKVVDWYTEDDQDEARLFLEDNGISYIYWIKPQRALLGDQQLGVKLLFENEEVIIYKYE